MLRAKRASTAQRLEPCGSGGGGTQANQITPEMMLSLVGYQPTDPSNPAGLTAMSNIIRGGNTQGSEPPGKENGERNPLSAQELQAVAIARRQIQIVQDHQYRRTALGERAYRLQRGVLVQGVEHRGRFVE